MAIWKRMTQSPSCVFFFNLYHSPQAIQLPSALELWRSHTATWARLRAWSRSYKGASFITNPSKLLVFSKIECFRASSRLQKYICGSYILGRYTHGSKSMLSRHSYLFSPISPWYNIPSGGSWILSAGYSCLEHAKRRRAKGAQKGLSHPLKRSCPDSFLPPSPSPFPEKNNKD